MSYKDLPFPWSSKSKILSLNYCEFDFYDGKVLGNKMRKKREAIEGTNMHIVVANFFASITKDDVFKKGFTDSSIPINKHPFRRFIYNRLMEYVKPGHRDYSKYKNILRNLATIECERFLRLNSYLNNKDEIFDCFRPLHVEKRIEIESVKLFGTIDRINVEVMPGGSKKIAIYDYKTGRVPKQIIDHIDRGEMFDWKIPSYSMAEIHFYGLIYLLAVGYRLSDEVVSFLNDEKKWWFFTKTGINNVKKYKSKYLTSLGKKYKLFKDGKIFNPKDLIVGYYYLNGIKAYRPTKLFNYTSYKTALNHTNYYRTVKSNRAYVTHPREVFNDFACSKRNCSRYERCVALMKE